MLSTFVNCQRDQGIRKKFDVQNWYKTTVESKKINFTKYDYNNIYIQLLTIDYKDAKAWVDFCEGLDLKYRKSAYFLFGNMSLDDVKKLDKEQVKENIILAYDSWKNAPWSSQIDEQQYLQYILPSWNVNERRDNWRKDFVKRFRERAWKFKTINEASVWLNGSLNDELKVYFHATKRPKPDQSVYESIEAGYASCTGLSILLINACRAVGIPARFVGVPIWSVTTGNHNWVEVFEDRWYNIGGTSSDIRNDDWVNGRVLKEAIYDNWWHAVYAACYKKTSLHFPLVWDYNDKDTPALNITYFYTLPFEITFPTKKKDSKIEVYWSGECVARLDLKNRKDSKIRLAGKSLYEVVYTDIDGKKTIKQAQVDGKGKFSFL